MTSDDFDPMLPAVGEIGMRPVPRNGDWMQTFTGRQFWPIDPHPDEIDVRDIAHALSNLCRFGGHCRSLYVVGDHSVRVCDAAPRADRMFRLALLLHDATEAYVVDVPRPLKRSLSEYKIIEDRLARCVEVRFDLEHGILDHPMVKHYDEVLLATEVRDLMSTGRLSIHATPLPDVIVPRTPEQASDTFLERFEELRGAR